MAKPKRELRNICISAKITESTEKKIISICENKGISASEFINRSIENEIKKNTH